MQLPKNSPSFSTRAKHWMINHITLLFVDKAIFGTFHGAKLAASQHNLIRDKILNESLTIYFASGLWVKRTEATGMFQVEVSGTGWNNQVAKFQQSYILLSTVYKYHHPHAPLYQSHYILYIYEVSNFTTASCPLSAAHESGVIS